MFDWILFVVAPMIMVGLVAVVVAGALAICAGVTNWIARKEARAAAEAAESEGAVAAE